MRMRYPVDCCQYRRKPVRKIGWLLKNSDRAVFIRRNIFIALIGMIGKKWSCNHDTTPLHFTNFLSLGFLVFSRVFITIAIFLCIV